MYTTATAATASGYRHQPASAIVPKAVFVRNIYNEIDAIVFGPEAPAAQPQAVAASPMLGFLARRAFGR